MIKMIVKDENGLHARPASLIAKEAMQYDGEVVLIKNSKEYNAKSIMKIMSMGIQQNEEIYIKAEGENSDKFEERIKDIIEGKE
ncbi:MAG: HPr family phosphocarrier protein [Clostridiales bacterium]|nr:MAG: HPr family phosphocarrier protein [Clostridiales bacterium]